MTKAEIEKRIEELECRLLLNERYADSPALGWMVTGDKAKLRLLRQQLAELVNNQLLGE